MITVEFYGGPWDGVRKELEHAYPTFVVATMLDPVPGEEVKVRQICYSRQHWSDGSTRYVLDQKAL